jgi:hypothetical protein
MSAIRTKGPRGKPRQPRQKPPKPKKPPGPNALKDKIHLTGTGTGQKLIQFTFSEDIIDRLLELHDEKFMGFYFTAREARKRRLRLQFVRLTDLKIPAVMIMVEPPSYDPRGRLARRISRRYICTVSARRLGLRPGIPRRDPEWFWADNMLGLIINFEDEDMLGTPPPRPKPGEPWDLVSRK